MCTLTTAKRKTKKEKKKTFNIDFRQCVLTANGLRLCSCSARIILRTKHALCKRTICSVRMPLKYCYGFSDRAPESRLIKEHFLCTVWSNERRRVEDFPLTLSKTRDNTYLICPLLTADLLIAQLSLVLPTKFCARMLLFEEKVKKGMVPFRMLPTVPSAQRKQRAMKQTVSTPLAPFSD